MANRKEIPKKPTPQEIETSLRNPLTREKDIEATQKLSVEVNNQVLRGEADVEIKKDALGQKYAVITHGNEIVQSTADPEEVAQLEDFLRNPKEFLRKKQLKEMEEKLAHEVEEEILKPYTQNK